MREWLAWATEQAVTWIDLIVLVVVVGATIGAVVGVVRVVVTRASTATRREVWLRYARWLIAGLTFQLAGDILETAISTDWESITRLGVVALIRTFLNYFLERDTAERGGLEEGA